MKTIATFEKSGRPILQVIVGTQTQGPKSGKFTPNEHEN